MSFLSKLDELTRLDPQEGSFTSEEGFNRFSNRDLDPTKPEQRKWRWYHVGGFWISEGFNLAQMQTVSSAIAIGLNPGLAVGACVVGNLLVIIPCAVSGYLGCKYGINFPVLVRASFGIWGSYLAVLFRGVFCFILYGVQGVLGGTAVFAMLTAMSPSFATWHENAIPMKLGITAPEMISFWVFWLASFPFLFLSIPTLRWLFVFKICVVPFFWVAMFTWALTAGGGFGPLFSIPNKIENGFSVSYAFFYCMTAAIGGNATFALNMADVTRYSNNTRQAWASQLWAGPLFLSATELLGALLGATSQVVYGQVLFNPVSVILLWDNRCAKFFAGFMLAICNIGTNVSGNSIPFGNDLMAWFPRRINIRRGQIVCAFLGVLIQPWYINANGATFLAFINGYSTFLGPVCGVYVSDYFFVRRGKGYDLKALYQPHGVYWFWRGINLRAIAALVCAITPNLPGLFQSMGVNVTNRGILNYFSATWVTGTVIAGLVFYVLNLIFPPVYADASSYIFDKADIIVLDSIEGQAPNGSISDLSEQPVGEDEKRTVAVSQLSV